MKLKKETYTNLVLSSDVFKLKTDYEKDEYTRMFEQDLQATKNATNGN